MFRGTLLLANPHKHRTKGSPMDELTPTSSISTGPGLSAAEVGKAVFDALYAWDVADPSVEDTIRPKYWSPEAESIEADGSVFKGLDAIRAKTVWWEERYEVRRFDVQGPFLGATGFAILFEMEIAEKATGNVSTLKEIGVYTVQGGRIVREEFMGANTHD